MLTVGLTGGIGSGKSTAARLFAERGAPVIDADLLAREVVASGTPALQEIRARFGEGILRPDGSLDRAALAEVVFSDSAAKRDLEAITHPRISAAAQARMAAAEAAGEPMVIYEAALLVEKGLHLGLDVLVVVSARPETQLRRLMAREGWTEKAAATRIAAQLPLAEKVLVADYVIDNDGPLENTIRQVDDLWLKLRHGTAQDHDPA